MLLDSNIIIYAAKPDHHALRQFIAEHVPAVSALSYVEVKDLRETIHNAASDVRIAILDSCASGAFTRIKGGRKRLPFLLDSAYDMRGYAALTSSSSSEASQESDLIKGSFFTHYLISGMRGGADMSQDGRVTLNEAYQFAFNETLAETTKTVGGPQHPNNHIQMTGPGDVVMTDIRKASAVLKLHEDLFGRLFIHDRNDQLVVELTKAAGRKIELGLEEGSYRVISIPGDAVFESKVELKSGVDFELTPAHFIELHREYTTPRGDHIEDDLDGGSEPDRADVTAFHGATDASKVDVWLRTSNGKSRELFENLKYGKFDGQESLPPVEAVLDLTLAGDETVVASFTADLTGLAGSSAVVFASGFFHPAANGSGPVFGLYAALPDGRVLALPPAAAVQKLLPETAAIPAVFGLADQNAPNPFNPTTRIAFALPAESWVRLSVFDVRGRMVSTLVEGALPAGRHMVDFQGEGLGFGNILLQARHTELHANPQDAAREIRAHAVPAGDPIASAVLARESNRSAGKEAGAPRSGGKRSNTRSSR